MRLVGGVAILCLVFDDRRPYAPILIAYLHRMVCGVLNSFWVRGKKASITKIAGLYTVVLVAAFVATEYFYFAAQYAVSAPYAFDAETQSNMHLIQIGMERYATDHNGLYPTAPSVLLTEGYFKAFPKNAFNPRESMRAVPWDQPSSGEFSFWVNSTRELYCIAGYGRNRRDNEGAPHPRVAVFFYNSHGSVSDPSLPESCRKDMREHPYNE